MNKHQKVLMDIIKTNEIVKPEHLQLFQELGKLTPEKPLWINDDEQPVCPFCQRTVDYGDYVCEVCYQQLDWSKK